MRSCQSKSAFALILATFSVGLLNSTAAAQTYFYNRVSIPTGNHPSAVAVSDFNGDGRMDLAITNSQDSTVSIFLGKPDGTFSAKTDIPVASSPQAVAVGDFNSDGVMDLAIIAGVNSVSILLGNGDGTFRAEGDYPSGTWPLRLIVADLNHDGKADLAVMNENCTYPTCGSGPGSVSILFGNGDGSFQPKADYDVPAGPNAIVAADLNGDGRPDLAVTCFTSNPITDFVSVLINKGDGTFQPHIDYPTSYGVQGLAAADFDGDGKLDLVAAAQSPNLLLGNGDGTFQAAKQVPLPAGGVMGAYGVQAADLNRDGKMDFVVANNNVSGVSIFLGNGDGTFPTEVDYMANPGQGDMALSDVNGDGALDVVLTNWSGGGSAANTVTVLLGNGDGTFSPRVALPMLPPYGSTNWTAESAVFGDFNGDGKPDLLVSEVNQAYTPNQAAQVFFPGNGDGTLGTPVLNNLAGGFLAAADFNGDGKLDLLLSPTYGLALALGNGDGTFGTPNRFLFISGFTVQGAVTGDFNHDGKTDAVVLANGNIISPSIYVLLGNGDGTFLELPPFWSSPPSPIAIVAVDFNHDGNLDLAMTLNTSNPNLAVLLGNGDGTFKTPAYYSTDFYPGGLAVADLNGDGIPDLIATAQKVDVYLGNGNGTFKAPVYYDTGSFPSYVVTGDFNGDGKADMAVVNAGYLSILLGKGDGTFQPPVNVNDNSYSYAPVAGDLNRDGVTDLYTGFGTGSLFLSRPLVSVFPGGLKFGSQDIGTESAPATLTLTNVGNSGLLLTNLVTPGGFGATNSCTSKVSRGAQCTIDVTYAPTSAGPAQGLLTLIDNTPTGSQSIPLTGVATSPSAGLSPSSLTFASQLVGTTSTAKTITLSNSGNGALIIASMVVSGDFSQIDTCGSSLAAGANCTINITFKPTTGGSRTGHLTITDNASGSPQTVSLNGTGTGPGVSLSSPLTFSSQLVGSTSSSQTVTLTNTGNATLTLSSIAATGPFAVASAGTTCSTSNPVAAAATCTVAVTFTPTAGGGASGSLSFSDNVPNSPQTVTLAGTGQDFALTPHSGSSMSATVTPGQPANFTLTVGGQGGMSGAVAFTCAGAPSGATCAVSPNPAMAGSSATNVTVTVTTTAPSLNVPRTQPLPPAPPLAPGLKGLVMLTLILVVATWITLRRRQFHVSAWPLVPLTAGLLLLLGVAACGGGGGGGGGSTIHNLGTPAGTYTLTVTGTMGSGSSAVSHSMNLTLNVS